MPDETPESAGSPASRTPGASRRRRNVIGSSSHRDEYVRLIENGWSSASLEKYAFHRYGESIPASTFRTYRQRHGLKPADSKMRGKEIDPDRTLDVIAVRQELIALQMERIGIDAQHERDMKKLFGTTSREIKLLSELLDAAKSDLQDVGLMGKAGETLTVKSEGLPEEAKALPGFRTLGEALGATGTDDAALAKVLHLALPKPPSGPNGNAPST